MAWVEAAVVIYLRTMVDRIDPYQANPLPLFGNLGEIELIREAATLIMLLCIGWLSGRNTRSRLAHAVIAFGVWDIFYYIFLWMMGPWPSSLRLGHFVPVTPSLVGACPGPRLDRHAPYH